MKNIVLTRIDDRLIHGQVVTAWIKQYPINKILIIDDELSQNRLMERIYKAAAPMGVEVLIQSVSEAREFLKEEPVRGENFLILVKVPEIIESLLKEGIEIEKVILGGMGVVCQYHHPGCGSRPGRRTPGNLCIIVRRKYDTGIQIFFAGRIPAPQ
ncbi:MAG: PTS sugar transporter subunit IIB [Enterocloster clostridioformis]|nr:PTS sugar transporter subunit IIB [Enterocloster clostridioformis]